MSDREELAKQLEVWIGRQWPPSLYNSEWDASERDYSQLAEWILESLWLHHKLNAAYEAGYDQGGWDVTEILNREDATSEA